MFRFQGFTANTTIAGEVRVGGYHMSLSDFVFLAAYVLTNTDLEERDDPRLELVKAIRESNEVAGFNPGKRRIRFGTTSLSAVTPL